MYVIALSLLAIDIHVMCLFYSEMEMLASLIVYARLQYCDNFVLIFIEDEVYNIYYNFYTEYFLIN